MILELCAALARAQEPAPPVEAAPVETAPVETAPVDAEAPAPAADEPVDLLRYRAPFDVVVNRTIGTASTPVEFDWRHSPAQFAASGSFLLELNNYDSARIGVLARIPSGGLLFEIGASAVGVWDTPSSRMLALTPYRQPGRPDRFQLDLDVGLPVAEGVVTVAPRWFPAVQMVFVAYGGVRYEAYPGAFGGMTFRQVAGAIVSPALTDEELANLDRVRPQAMAVDPARYGLVAGFGDDLYFDSGLFLSPRVMFGVPILAPVSESEMLFWADLSLVLGVAL